jgi:hypothetical protein
LATSQKDANRFPLMVMLTVNAAVFWGLVTTQQVDPAAWIGSFQGNLKGSLPVALALVLTGILNSQVTPFAKAKLVFLDWQHPLPGCRAFSEYLRRDNRIDAAHLERRFGPFPDDPDEQNRCWYGIYQTVRDAPAVTDANKGYLFGRDYAALMVLAILIFGGLSLALIKAPLVCIGYIAVLVLQYVLAANSARNHAIRLVTNTMAIASQEGRNG